MLFILTSNTFLSNSVSDEFFATQDKVIGDLVQNFHKKLDDFEIDVSSSSFILALFNRNFVQRVCEFAGVCHFPIPCKDLCLPYNI